MNNDNPANMQNEDLENNLNSKDIDVTDAAENHSTAADGDALVDQAKTTGFETPADMSEGNLPDAEFLSDNEEGEYDREKIADK